VFVSSDILICITLLKDFGRLHTENTKMKKFLRLLLLLILFCPTTNLFSQGKWVYNSSPTTVQLNTLFCIDSLTCWAAGDSGIVLQTTNGGADWIVQDLGVLETIRSIFFLNDSLGWAVSSKLSDPYGSFIHKTTNGGNLWQTEFFPIENAFLQTVYFIDSLVGWVGGSGNPSTFYGTTDGGLTWNIPRFDSSLYSTLPVTSFKFYSPQYAFASGGAHDLVGVIWSTKDSGQTWLAVPMGPEPLQELQFIDSLTIVGVGGDFEFGTGIARSTDGGDSWTYTEPGFFGVCTGLSFRTDYEGWGTLGPQEQFIFSNDSGRTWITTGTVDTFTVYDVVFTDSLHGFAVGDNGDYDYDSTYDHRGIILKYKADIDSTVEVAENYSPLDFYLFQNYPNPFNPSTKIKWQSSVGGWQTLKIFDVLGNEIATLVNEYRPAGRYEVEFQSTTSGFQLASGIYFYTLSEGAYSESKKMILLR